MGNDLLERKIDTNDKNGIEDKELLAFIGNQKNVEELGNYLNAMPFKDRGDKLLYTTQKQIDNNYFSISKKIKSNESLTIDEKNIMKLQYFLDNKSYPQTELILNGYLGVKFGNAYYLEKNSFVKENTPVMTSQIENRELSEGERKLQIETILETGQYYIQFLQDKGILQSQYEGDIPQQNIYYKQLQTKYTNGEKLRDSDILFYIHQIFRDISTSGTGYSAHAGDAYKEIDALLTTKQGRNKKNIGDKIIDIMYQLRQVDDAKGIYYKSSDMLLTLLTKDLGACRINRGPDSWKLNSTLMQFNLLKPSENGSFSDPIIENMYRGFQHPSSLGNSDILTAFKKYKLPFEGASQEAMDDLQEELQEQIAPMKQKEVQQKLDIKKNIIDNKKQEIVMQNKQKEMIKKEFQNQNIDLTNPVAQQTIAYFDQQIVMNNNLIQGKAIEIETLDGGKTFITLDMVVTQQYEAMEIKLIADIVQKGIVYEVLHQNQKTTNFIQGMKKSGIHLTTDEKTIDMLADITGAGSRYNGGYVSDKTFNTAVDVAKELVIQVALMAISGGIANIAAKGTLLAIQGGAKLLKAGSYVTRVANYTNMSKTAFWSSMKLMPELFAADIIAEGTVFHLANTTLNAPLQGLSTEEYFKRINPFGKYQEQQADGSTKDVSSVMGYIESIAFMGVMKSFGSLTTQVTKALGGKALNATQQSQTIKNVLMANAITLPGEILAMQGTSAVIGLSFGHEVDLTPQSRANTLALVIGLRIAHGATSPMKKFSENIEGKIQESSMQQGTLEIQKVIYDKTGNVQAVEYRVVDNGGKEVDKGIASSATIDAAMKNKKAEQINSTENNSQEQTDRSRYSSEELQNLYDVGEKNIRALMKKLQQEIKEKKISPEEYTQQMEIFRKKYPEYGDISDAKNREAIATHTYPISEEQIQSYMSKLGKDIQAGGGNAQGVFEIEGSNLVAIVKSERSYPYELPIRTAMQNVEISSVVKVIDIFVYQGKTYKIMEKSPGIQMDKLTPEQIQSIPQEHYDKYIQDAQSIEKAGLQIDPSKPSNFFYDKLTGFHFIDLGIKESNWSMFDHVRSFNAKNILDNEKIQIAKEKNSARAVDFSNQKEGETIQYKVYETKFLEIKKDIAYSMETVELNGCTAAVLMIKNTQGKSFALATHFPPIESFRSKSITDIKKYLEDNKVAIGDIESIEIFAVTDVSRKNTDYQTIADIVKENMQIEPVLHLSEYASKDKSRAAQNTLGKMEVTVNKEGEVIFTHEGKLVDISNQKGVNVDAVNKFERPDLRKMNPDTQVIIDKLKTDYPGLEPLFKSMIVKDYTSEVVQQHLADLNLLPKELIAKIISKDIVFFISNEGVTSWVGNVELKGTTPRGWEETGLTWDNVAGLADEVGGVCAGKGEHGSVSLVLHELGHQIDFKGIVDTKELNSLYEKLKSEKTLNEYFLQEGEAGLQEFFAETFGEYYKLSKAEFVQKYNEEYYTKLQEKFPKEKTTTPEVGKVKIQKNRKIVSPETIEKNSKLSDVDRIIEAKELLGDITPIQEQAILDAHNQPGEIKNLDFSQIRARFDILQKAEFTSEQIRILMENGICGKNTRERIMTILEPIKNFLARGEVDLALSYVEKIAPSMEYVATEAPKKLIDIPRAFLDGYLRSKGVAEPSDLIVFFGDIKKLKDSIACSIQLYTENLGNINKLEETVANAKLPRDKRVNVGCKIIENVGNFKLSETQREIMNKAIMKAHIYGHMETGKNGDATSIYNYTMRQLGNKMYILMDAMQKCGIDYKVGKDIAKELLRKGICGEAGIGTLDMKNISEILQENLDINTKDVEYLVANHPNSTITKEAMLEGIKKFNILSICKNQKELEVYIQQKKNTSDATYSKNMERLLVDGRGGEKMSYDEKNDFYKRYTGNYNPETGKYTIARDIKGTDFDEAIIQDIIQGKGIEPRGLEQKSEFELLKQLHDSKNYEIFILYSKYLLGEDITHEAGVYSQTNTGGFVNDPALYRHTKIDIPGTSGIGFLDGRQYRIIADFLPGEIVRSGTESQLSTGDNNFGEHEWITLGKIAHKNIKSIINLETGKSIYEREDNHKKPQIETPKENIVTGENNITILENKKFLKKETITLENFLLPIEINLAGQKNLHIIKGIDTEYMIVDPNNPTKEYKRLSIGETVLLGRNNPNSFAFNTYVSGDHIEIYCEKYGKIQIKDRSTNGTGIKWIAETKDLKNIGANENNMEDIIKIKDAYKEKRKNKDKMMIISAKDSMFESLDIALNKGVEEKMIVGTHIKDAELLYEIVTGEKFKRVKGADETAIFKDLLIGLDQDKRDVSMDQFNKAKLEKLRKESIELDFDKLEYVMDGEGSNGGKRYKHIETNKEYFVKAYENFDQSKSEFVTNMIYQELGLGSPKSHIMITGKGTFLATEKVNGIEEITNVIGIQDGFVADCWLANRDGTKQGNVLQGSNGTIYRVDNGGSLFFRAQGKNKESFSNAEVTEISSLRDKNINGFAHKFFGSISDKEIIAQVKTLKEKMTDEKIKELVYKGDISNKDKIVETLITRRDWLVKNYDIDLSAKPEVKKIEYSKYDKETLEKIENKESILGRIPTLKRTYRTDFATLKLILESGCIGTNKGRGNDFWGGLGAGYGDVIFIMRPDIENLPAAYDVPGNKVKGKENMTYFWENDAQGMGMDLETFSNNFGDFAKIRNGKGDNPHINSPYLMLGGQNGGTAFENTVSVSSAEAVMLPAHVKNDANYARIKAQIEKLGIKVIEEQTSKSILEYAGGSIINANNNSRGDYGIQIQNELKAVYPSLSFQEAAVKYLKDKGVIDINSIKSFYEIRNDYNAIASDAGLSRYNLSSSGQFENYVSAKNFTVEQKAYFTYLIQSKYDK